MEMFIKIKYLIATIIERVLNKVRSFFDKSYEISNIDFEVLELIDHFTSNKWGLHIEGFYSEEQILQVMRIMPHLQIVDGKIVDPSYGHVYYLAHKDQIVVDYNYIVHPKFCGHGAYKNIVYLGEL